MIFCSELSNSFTVNWPVDTWRKTLNLLNLCAKAISLQGPMVVMDCCGRRKPIYCPERVRLGG